MLKCERCDGGRFEFQDLCESEIADPEKFVFNGIESSLNPLAAPFISGMQVRTSDELDTGWEYVENSQCDPVSGFEILFQYDPEKATQIEDLQDTDNNANSKIENQLSSMHEVGCRDTSRT